MRHNCYPPDTSRGQIGCILLAYCYSPVALPLPDSLMEVSCSLDVEWLQQLL